METAFLLMAQYGARAIVPLELVCADYFSHLTPAKLILKVNAGEINLPLIRLDESQQAASAVHLIDLAAYLDAQRAKAILELERRAEQPCRDSVSRDTRKLSIFIPSESASDLIRLPEVKKLTGISSSKIYNMISVGDFPRQVSLGDRAVAWVRGEVLDWCRARVKASR